MIPKEETICKCIYYSMKYCFLKFSFDSDVVYNLGNGLRIAEALANICSTPVIESICVSLVQLLAGNVGVKSFLSEAVSQSAITLLIVVLIIYCLKSAIVGTIAVSGGNYLSTKILWQYGQFILDGRFHEFDYMNPKKNSMAYGQPHAPDYPLHKITSRNIVIFRGLNDPYCAKNDLDHLLSSLTSKNNHTVLA